MAYDEELADRLRWLVEGEPGLSERPMFGGLAFLVAGNLAVSASSRGGLLLRVDPARTDEYVGRAGVDRFVMRGRAMDGWLHVPDEAIADDGELERWVTIGLEFTRSLPPKR